MVDLLVQKKQRLKVKNLVECKVKEGMSEKEAKKEVMKEQRLKKKQKKAAIAEEVKQKVLKELGKLRLF